MSSYTYRPDVWPAVVTLALVVYLGLYSWRRRHIAGATPFTIACAFGLLWALGVIMEISAVTFPTQVFWNKFQAVWLLPMATTITCFILQFAGFDRWLRLRTYALLFLVPVLHIVAIATNDLHHLLWTGFELGGHVVPSHGRLYWFFNGYVYLLGLVNLAVLVWLAVRSPRHRWPVTIIISAQIVGRIGYTLERTGHDWLGPGGAVLATVGVVAVSYAIAFFGFHVIDPVAAARTSVLQQMREGMFVVDPGGRILDVNPMAAAIVDIPENELLGRAVSDVLPLDIGVSGGVDGTAENRAEITLGSPDRPRLYDVNVTPLVARDGELIARLLLLHDVTEQRHAHARIVEQQEVVATLRERERLGRELHDGIGQTLAYVGMQAQTALRWVRDSDTDRAAATLERLADVAHDAHSDVRESILNLKADSLEGWSLIPTLRTYLEKFQAHSDIRTELSISRGIGDETVDPAAGVQLLRVIQEALTNSRKHSGATNVMITIATNGNRTRITITDDGTGFDTNRSEGRDGSHFGLRVMRERIEQIGGTLRVDSTPGSGTVLTLDVPAGRNGRNVRESPAG